MSTNKAERGTKRTCQNPECGQRFYDLNHSPIVCPICEATYKVDASTTALAAAGAAGDRASSRRAAPKKPVYVPVEPKPDEVPEGEEALAGIEADEEEPAAAEEDETFLEAEEEDGSDMSNIIGGPVAETDEQQ